MRQDEAKKEFRDIGWLFFISMVVHVLASLFINLLGQKNIVFPIEVSLIISEMTILIPSLVYVLIKKPDLREDLGFRRIKTGTFFMCILMALLVAPVASFFNVLSQLFVKNEMVQLSGTLLEGSSVAVWLLGSVYGPLCEEFMFRSIICNRYAGFISPLRAGLISAMFFALAHLNVNQAMYAFVLGFVFSVINRAAKSVYPSLIIHVCINGTNLLALLVSSSINKALGAEVDLAQAAEMARKSEMIYVMIGGTFVLAVISTVIAIPCIIWMAKHEDNIDGFSDMFKKGHQRISWMNIPTACGIIFSLLIMFGLDGVLKYLAE